MSATIGTSRRADDLLERRGALRRRAGHADDVGARLLAAADLVDRRPASEVGVLVIVWTVIGASPPTGTLPTMIWRDLRRSISRQGRIEDMAAHIGAARRGGKATARRFAPLIRSCVNALNGKSRGRPMPKLARLPASDRAPDAAPRARRRLRRPAPLFGLPQLQPPRRGDRRLAARRARGIPRSPARWSAS